jgi:hypothetical protein
MPPRGADAHELGNRGESPSPLPAQPPDRALGALATPHVALGVELVARKSIAGALGHLSGLVGENACPVVGDLIVGHFGLGAVHDQNADCASATAAHVVAVNDVLVNARKCILSGYDDTATVLGDVVLSDGEIRIIFYLDAYSKGPVRGKLGLRNDPILFDGSL